jgi:hypothetical protein
MAIILENGLQKRFFELTNDNMEVHVLYYRIKTTYWAEREALAEVYTLSDFSSANFLQFKLSSIAMRLLGYKISIIIPIGNINLPILSGIFHLYVECYAECT